MRWIEIINVRLAASADCAQAQRLFSDIMNNVATSSEEQVRVAVYRNGMLEGDWAIHLHRDTDNRPSSRTWLGIKLADEVRRIALVDHSVWIEED